MPYGRWVLHLKLEPKPFDQARKNHFLLCKWQVQTKRCFGIVCDGGKLAFLHLRQLRRKVI
jgi:hypothetical protein